MRIALVCMPFHSINRPSLGLGILKSVLTEKGYECDVHYLNFNYSYQLGLDKYKLISDFGPSDLIGEWIFSQFVFQKASEDDLKSYCKYISEKNRGGAINWRTQKVLFDLISEATLYADEYLNDLMKISWEEYDVIGFSTMFQQNMSSLALAKRIKSKYNNFIIFGGSNCEGVMGEGILESFPYVDAISIGEGEESFIELLKRIKDGNSIEGPGIITRESSKFIGNYPVDLNKVPLPNNNDWINTISNYYPNELSNVWWPYQTSRGCWWGEKIQCKFCGCNGEQISFRSKDPTKVLNDIHLLSKSPYFNSRILMTDSIIDYRYFNTLLPQLNNNDIKLHIFWEVKSNLTKIQVKLLKESGVLHIQPGIESLSTRVLQIMGKGVTALQNIQFLKWCKEYGITPDWNILFGFIGENYDDFEFQKSIVKKIKHLPPPFGVNRIRLDRFSPYFEKNQEEKIKILGPHPIYKYIYRGLDIKKIEKIAYFFDYTHENLEQSEKWSNELRNEVLDWIENYGNKDLFLLVKNTDSFVCVVNNQEVQNFQLNNLQTWIIKECDSIKTIQNIEEHGMKFGYKQKEIFYTINDLIQKEWIIREENKILSIVLDLNIYRPKRNIRAKSVLRRDKILREIITKNEENTNGKSIKNMG